MTKKTNKNLFGMTVTALNDKVVSCAHMEPITRELTFQESLRRKDRVGGVYPQLGKQHFIAYNSKLNNKIILLFKSNSSMHY